MVIHDRMCVNVFAKVQIYNETIRTEKEYETDMSVFLVVK